MTAEEHQWVNHKNKEKSEVSMLEWAHYFTALKLPPAHCREYWDTPGVTTCDASIATWAISFTPNPSPNGGSTSC